MARECEGAHCSAVDNEINDICKSEGWAVGHPVLTRDSKGVCQCRCSCLALGTPVRAGNGAFRPIQDFKIGDMVLAAGPDLKWTEKEVKFSDGTTGKSEQPYTIFIGYGDGKSLIVTADHLFYMGGGRLKRADKLAITDNLIAPDGSEIAIDALSMGTFRGGFHHIATSTTDPHKDLNGHLLDVNGIVTSDYVVQLFHRAGELSSRLLVPDHDELPTMGTAEYEEKYGVLRDLEPSTLAAAAVVGEGLEDSDSLFIPANRARVAIPDDALNFISKEEAKALERYPKRSLTETDAQAWAEYLVTQFKAFYPAVIYEIDWYNNEVNAYAWRDGSGVGHVAILGGLIRFPAIKIEGLALVIAHELGHLLGGPPFYPGTDLSCEGQSDFYGARNVMRVVWFGEFYITVMVPAIKQLGELFGLPAFKAAARAAVGGCSHPPGPCRIDTYNAAVDLKPKPACAG